MNAPTRHARGGHRDSILWPLIPGALVGMIVGVVVFARIVEALR